jgi:hypothetical protein
LGFDVCNLEFLMKVVLSLELLQIEEDGCHLFISGRINGKKARFLVDTGASRSVVDQDRIPSFFKPGEMVSEKIDMPSVGLGTNSMPGTIIQLNSLSFRRLIVKNYKIVALDLSHVNQSFRLLKMKKIDGVLGGDLLHRLNAVINYRKLALTLKA